MWTLNKCQFFLGRVDKTYMLSLFKPDKEENKLRIFTHF